MNPGTLYILATPIGNLEDVSARARTVLTEVDMILAEDTRRTRPFLNHLGIQKKIISYFEYSSQKKDNVILDNLKNGQSYALVSDAGTPTISDPGAKLVAKAHDQDVLVVTIPGPNAFVSAISLSGFPSEPLHFWGFLSPKLSKRKKVYDQIVTLQGSHCFYESPHKLIKRLQEFSEYFPDYYVFVVKEMTKKFESYWRGTTVEVFDELSTIKPRGEYTLVLSSKKF